MKFGGLYSKFHGSFPLMTINSFMITASVMKELMLKSSGLRVAETNLGLL